MIKVEQESNEIVVWPKDDVSRHILGRPLHRLFLGGTLSATPSPEGRWIFSASKDPAKQLQALTAHFERYGLDFELDDEVSSCLREAEGRRVEYQSLLSVARRAKESRQDLDSQLRERLSQGFVRELTELQRMAVRHLLAIKNGANFSVPGSGKTSVALAYYHLLRAAGVVKSILVIGPISSFRPWEDEFRSCFGREATVARFPRVLRSTRKEMYLTADQYDLLLTSYHTAARDQAEIIEMLRSRPTLLVLDESHYVKRPVGGRLADSVLRMAPQATRRIILTGTPMPNGLADIWSQVTFLWPEELPLGSSDSYLFKIRRSDDESLTSEVREMISPLFYRVSKADLHLPTPQFKVVRCDMNPAQARIYKGVAARFLSQTNEAPTDQDALAEWRRARAVRLLQIAVNPALLKKTSREFKIPPLDLGDRGLKVLIDRYAEFEVPEKINQACAIAREVCGSDRKVLVWSTFVRNLEMLAEHLSDLQPAIIHGGVPYGGTDKDEITREIEIERFKSDPSCQALIANPAACAESISLHGVCHDAIYVDRSFNCAHYLQSLDRIHRLGLPPDVETTYYLLLARGTIDEIVGDRLGQKMERLRELVEPQLPGEIPGFWGEEIDEEGARDYSLVEEHIRDAGGG